MLKNIKKRNEGFTIIEVLIVLAIAGLILLIVFLAVPALQRTQRNTSRKNDVSRLSGSITEYVANKNGALPATGDASGAGDAQNIAKSAGALAQYDFTTTAATDGKKFVIAAAATANLADVTKIQLAVKAKCTQPIDGTTAAAADRQMALQYTVESGSGGTQNLCTDL